MRRRRRAVLSDSSPLVEAVVTGKWKDVVEICKNNPDLHSARVTISGETALHVAISDGRTEIVKQLVELVMRNNARKAALTAANERGNTPLHLAAAIGNVEMCRCIDRVDGSLIACRNRDGETPLFLAVLHGRHNAFFELLPSRTRPEEGRDYSLCRRKDGNTILHFAITQEHFTLAMLIIDVYPDLVDAVSADGFSPLHMLATKPSAFRSGTTITGFSRLIYDIDFTRILHPNRAYLDDLEDPNNTENLHHRELDGRCALMRHCISCFKGAMAIFVTAVLYLAVGRMARILNRKMFHRASVELLDELLQRTSMYKNPDDDGSTPPESQPFDDDDVEIQGPRENDETVESSVDRRPKPLLIAAKNGITEIVERWLARFPVAVFETDQAMKNIVLLAVEHRQPQVYQLVLNLKTAKDTLFRQVDDNGNCVLHLSAKLGDKYRTQLNQDAALHLQREIKWFQYVRDSMPVGSSVLLNSRGETAEELFTTTHEDLVKVSAEWFLHVSESCSFVAALVATVAFATATTIPGGVKQDIGTPALEKEPAFYVFAISSLVALCFSVTSTVIFLAILTSGFQIRDFHTSLPRKLLMGLATLCVSIIAMMVSFCASHFFLLKDEMSYGAFGLYAAMALMPVIMTFFLISRFPHSFDLMWATFSNRPLVIPPPERSDEMILP